RPGRAGRRRKSPFPPRDGTKRRGQCSQRRASQPRPSPEMTAVTAANVNFKWDPKSLEIRTLAVERLLEPLVTQVTTLVNTSNKGPSNKKRGRSKKAHVLAASVEQATENFLEKGDKIAKESQFLKEELVAAVEDVRKQGDLMKSASGEFADDPCSSVKRGNMVRAARALLSAVTRLLILADMADVYKLLVQLKVVEDGLLKLRNAGTEQDLGIQYKALKPEVDKLNIMAAKRQQELKDVGHRDQMAAARGILQKNVPILYTASQACLQHPDVAAYKANRDLIYKQLQQAVSGISNAAQATASDDAGQQQGGGGELAYALNNFDERLESIISGAALMADSSCTRDDRRERIVAECNAVRQALQDLLSEYMGNPSALIFECRAKKGPVPGLLEAWQCHNELLGLAPVTFQLPFAGRKERSDALNSAIDKMTKKTRDLRRQLRKAVMDHVSDSFLETNVPLLVLIEAAKNGNEKEVKEYAQVFREHANKLIEVANLACSISNNEEGVKLVRMSASQLEALCPQVRTGVTNRDKPQLCPQVRTDVTTGDNPQLCPQVRTDVPTGDNPQPAGAALDMLCSQWLPDIPEPAVGECGELQWFPVPCEGASTAPGHAPSRRGFGGDSVRSRIFYLLYDLQVTELLNRIWVINAALALAAKPQSKLAQENMDLFKEQWERQNHILEDVNKCVIALQEKDVDGLDRTAGAIRGRAARVIHVVTSEMDNYEPGVYTEKVLEATKLLSNTVMPRFTEQVEAAVEALSCDPAQPMDENEFIDASRLVYDGIRDIRKAVLMIRGIFQNYHLLDLYLLKRSSSSPLPAAQRSFCPWWHWKSRITLWMGGGVTNRIMNSRTVLFMFFSFFFNTDTLNYFLQLFCMSISIFTISQINALICNCAEDTVCASEPALRAVCNSSSRISSEAFTFNQLAKALFILQELFFCLSDAECINVLTNLSCSTPEELDDSDFETEDFDVRSRTSIQTEDDQLIAGQSARAIMAQLPQEQKAKIAEQVASFQEEKSKLDAEVSKWDDSGNDIIVLAKQMCMIMMEMTDFTRGKGPLKNTSDVISAAKKIAEAGSRMDKLGRTIADHALWFCLSVSLSLSVALALCPCLWLWLCLSLALSVAQALLGAAAPTFPVSLQCPDSACKQDLLAYLQRIALYCHQLNICSKVKAEVQNLGGELVVSGVDSAMSLIQAAKNLMNAVVQTVKASYVASTKYQKSQGMASLNLPAVSWKMKAPEKKPLVKREKQDETQTKIKRASQKKHVNPVQALSEFKAMESI
ncbi:Catenin alpha-1, partial [Lamprotornis superbus]